MAFIGMSKGSKGLTRTFAYMYDDAISSYGGCLMPEALFHADEVIENQLDQRLEQLEKHINGHAIALFSPLMWGVEKFVRDVVEKRVADEGNGKLMVLLETAGGHVTAVERIVRVFRNYYNRVEFLIPSHAMSAGTVLAMSGNAIHMDYFSVLGPIDPQLEKEEGLMPALGYLEKYEELIEKSATPGGLTAAEITYLVRRFDPGDLKQFQHERDLTISMLKEWLVQYKFADWKRTRTRKKQVTKAMKASRATSIAKKLNNTNRWHSHSRGISKDVLERELKLIIEDFGKDETLARIVKEYYTLAKDYMRRSGVQNPAIIHARGTCAKLSWRAR